MSTANHDSIAAALGGHATARETVRVILGMQIYTQLCAAVFTEVIAGRLVTTSALGGEMLAAAALANAETFMQVAEQQRREALRDEQQHEPN